ncbi:MAG: 3'-5' exonuclease [Chlamydiota bacterium]|nr:3'-5' exonuclease [Chlamydiota bacterium]
MKDEIKYFIFDIETVSDGKLIQKIKYPDEAKLSPQEAIERYCSELLTDSEGKSDFIPWTYQIPVSIAVAKVGKDYELNEVVVLDRPHYRPQVISRLFWEGWTKYQYPTLVTFNGRGFDLPVLELAAFRYGIDVRQWFDTNGPAYQQPRNRFNPKSHYDLLELLSNYGAARISGGLDLCSTLLGKPGKLQTKGYMVQDIYNEGDYERINNYCMCDVLDTYFVFLRTRVMTGHISLKEEHQLVCLAHEWISTASKENSVLEEYLNHFSFWEPINDSDSPFLRS